MEEEDFDDMDISGEEWQASNVFLNEFRDAVEERDNTYREIGSEQEEILWQKERAEFKEIIFGEDDRDDPGHPQALQRLLLRQYLYSDLKIKDTVWVTVERVFELFCFL